jgi:hypothetical protein
MGTWDEYCIVCGCGIIVTPDEEIESKIIKSQDWLNKVTVVDQAHNVYHGGVYDGYGAVVFEKQKKNISQLVDEKNFTIACHDDCYKILQNELKYTLKMGDVKKKLSSSLNLLKVSYGLNKKSYSQFWNWGLLSENDVQSPLKNLHNKKRILKIWKPLVKKF